MNDNKILIESDRLESNVFDEEQVLRRLTRSVKFAEKYFLFFASCNQVPRQNKLIKQIKKELSGYQVQVINFDKPVESLLEELRRKLKNKKPDAVFVQGLRNSIPSAKKAKENAFIANLNVTRDSFPQLLSCPLILWLPEYAVGKLINGAPDFFSVRSGVFFFENDVNLLQHQVSEISGDYREIDGLLFEERQQRLTTLEELLTEYQSLPANKRDLQTEHQLKKKLADLYFITADYNKAENLCLELIDYAKQNKSLESLATHLNDLAYVYRSQGRYDEAIEKYEEALRIDEKTIGKEHPEYATRLNNLGLVYRSQGRYDEAIEKYEEALRIGEKTIGKEHPEYAIRLNNLAVVYQSQGRYDEAIEKYEEALRIGEKTIGKEHPEYATRLNNLANVYYSQGRYDEAIEKYEEALRIDEKTIGKEHPEYATRLNNLGLVYRSQGRYDEAIKKLEEALRIDEKTIGKEHPEYAIHLKNLGVVYESQEKYKDALDLYEKALSLFEKTLPENHPYTIQLKESVEKCRKKRLIMIINK